MVNHCEQEMGEAIGYDSQNWVKNRYWNFLNLE